MANSKQHVVVDAQLLQTSDRKRGMGLFTASLLNNFNAREIGMTWVINRRLGPLDEENVLLAKRLGAKIIEVDLLHGGDNELFAASVKTNRQRIDAAVAPLIAKCNRVTYFIPALFSSEIHPVFPTQGTMNIQLFHDAIPFLYHTHYFKDHGGIARKDYAQRFVEFYKTDLFVTNSQTTADDLVVYFGVDTQRIVPILGAAADRSQLTPRKPSGVNDDFILMPSGDDFRKNNTRAVQAFAALDTTSKLVITSRFSEGTRRELQALCPNAVFTGSVSDEEFLWLLDNARAVFFPPEYEGLGMPLLEAVERGAVIACSNIPVFTEISQEAFFYFDPKSVQDMTQALLTILQVDKKTYIKESSVEYKRILSIFSWKKAAKSFLGALEKGVPASPQHKLAVFTPSPSSYSAIGKYVFELHAELSRLFDVDYYAEDGVTAFDPTRPNILEYAAGYYPASSFTPEKAQQYEYVLYNLGNSEFHIDTILNALRLPANAVVHDTHLNGIFDWLERQRFLTPARRQVEAKLDELFETKNTTCLVSLASNQKVVFCHSDYATNAIKQLPVGGSPIITETILAIGVPTIKLKNLRTPTVSFAGIISEDKGINIVADIAQNKNLRVKVFGFGVLGDSPLLQNLNENVQVMKDLTDKEFQDALSQTDILVNYRPNYHGETSRSVLEAMRHGAVVIVRDIGWYGELPNDVVVKVRAENEIVPTIRELIADPQRIQTIGQAAKAFLMREYGYKKYAEALQRNMEKNAA